MKATIIKITMMTLFVTNIACFEANSNIYKLHEEGKVGKHTHTTISNGKKITVEIGKYLLEGSSNHIWYKIIKEIGKPIIRYTREHPSHKW